MSRIFNHGYALLIGVGETQYSRFSLPITVKDTKAIYAALTDLCGYPHEQIRVLNNAEATRDGILQGLSWLQGKVEADREATAIVYYSGHGWVYKNDNSHYLIPYDANGLIASKLAESALSAEVFTNKIRKIKADRLLVVIDSCHASGMATSKETDAELMNEFENVAFSKRLIDDLKQGNGRVVFTSSEGHQKSWFLDDQSLSIYTFHFLEALQGKGNQAGDSVVRVSNLMNYLSNTVPKTTQKIHGCKQTPHFDLDTDDFAISLLRDDRLFGFLVDVSASMTSSVNNLQDNQQTRFENFRNDFRKIIKDAHTLNDEQKNSIRFFVLGFGFAHITNPNYWLNNEHFEKVRDLLEPNSTVSLKQIEDHFSEYEKNIDDMVQYMGMGVTPMAKAFKLAQRRFGDTLGNPPYKNQPILFILSDGTPTRESDEIEVVEISRQLQKDGILIISCYLTDVDIVQPKYLYNEALKEWKKGAKIMFDCASIADPNSLAYEHFRELEWEIQSKYNSRLFTQINQSSYLSQYIGVINKLLAQKIS